MTIIAKAGWLMKSIISVATSTAARASKSIIIIIQGSSSLDIILPFWVFTENRLD